MQLFAIIARPQSNREDRMRVVESFLLQQLNRELVEEYLKVFDSYYTAYQERQMSGKRRQKSIALSSVKILRIGTEINQELIQQQKVVVLIRLLEFIKSDTAEITNQELEFVATVSSIFNVPEEEYEHLKIFVINSIYSLPHSEEILLIDNNTEPPSPNSKHMYSAYLHGQIRILNVPSVNMQIMRYLGESELYLNGQLIQEDKAYVLSNGSSIRSSKVRPIYYSDIVGIFNLDKIKSKIVFEANNISYQFNEGTVGLHDLTFKEESGRLVGIMGASGAGKSTLLNVLNGNYIPSQGKITINGLDLRQDNDRLDGLIGYVSQDDLLIEELTVFQNLYYNAKLCFGDYTEEELVETVDQVLQSLGLSEIKHMRVGSTLNKKISGGQRKRLNIALELIREPAILFLDEPTSGLSSRDSENIMDLLKELALKGKLVIVVIHQPSSDIFKMFDRLIILDYGGYLIYQGDPIESIIYFKSRVQKADWNDSECRCCGNVNPEQIFNIVEAQVLDEYGNLTPTRKISPREWYSYYMSYNADEAEKLPGNDTKPPLPAINFKIPNRIVQWGVFLKRDVLAKLTNSQYLLINSLMVPLLAFGLSIIIKYYSVVDEGLGHYVFFKNSNLPVYLFMAVIIAIFVGLTLSAEEIIKDRKILQREAFLNLSRSSYLLSKISIMFFISAIQAFLFVLIGNYIMEIKGMFMEYWLILFSTWAFANLLGLNISDSLKSTVTIYISIPFLVIPQIILSGVIVQFDKLNPVISSPVTIPWYGQIITARWSYEALAVEQYKDNKYEQHFYIYDRIINESTFKKEAWAQTLQNRVNETLRYLHKPEKKPRVEDNLILLRNEIGKEVRNYDKAEFPGLADFTFDKVTEELLRKVKDFIKKRRNFYKVVSNRARKHKNQIKLDLIDSLGSEEKLSQLDRNYTNNKLEEFVMRDEYQFQQALVYKNRIYKRYAPIFHVREQGFFKAQFYSPEKFFMGGTYDTFWANLAVIWGMSLILYLTLHFKGAQALAEAWGQLRKKMARNKNNAARK